MRALRYDRDDEDWFYFEGNYHELINSFEYEILTYADEDDWQGDSWYLLRDGQRYGYLQFGWGSCSGCDTLAACSNLDEATQLRDELHSSVMWFDDANVALNWFRSHDWEGDFAFGDNELVEFRKEAEKILLEERRKSVQF